MIPPYQSLVKYDNPVLLSRTTDKKSNRVRVCYVFMSCVVVWCCCSVIDRVDCGVFGVMVGCFL